MNHIGDESPMCIQCNICQYDIWDLQPGYANPGSSESDLVSGKIKETVTVYYNSITIMIIYNTCFLTVIPYNYTNNQYL